MDFRQKERLKKIIEHYGEEAQVKKAAEEFAELIRALMRGDRDNIAEEMADCRIMLDQLEIIYKADVRVNYWECLKTARVLAGVMREEAEGERCGRPLQSASQPASPKGEAKEATSSGADAPPSPEGEGMGDGGGKDGKNDRVKD